MSYVIRSQWNTTLFQSPSGEWAPLSRAIVFTSAEMAEEFIARNRIVVNMTEVVHVESIDLDDLLSSSFTAMYGGYEDDDGEEVYLSKTVLRTIASDLADYIQVRLPPAMTRTAPSGSVDVDAVRALAHDPNGPLMARIHAEVWEACCDAIAATAEPEPETDDPDVRDGPDIVDGIYSAHAYDEAVGVETRAEPIRDGTISFLLSYEGSDDCTVTYDIPTVHWSDTPLWRVAAD